MSAMRIVSSASARPNFVKLAAVHHALKNKHDIEHLIVHTGQHYDPLFSDIFFQQLDIPHPVENLQIHTGTQEEVILRTREKSVDAYKKLQPDLVLVYGDVNGAVGAAQAAHALGIPLAHVEAGLRSFDQSMPEEVNRIAIDQLADILLVSEQSGMDNLQREGCKGHVEFVGNTMIDSLIRMLPLIERESLPTSVAYPYCVLTLHRPSNVDTAESLQENIEFIAKVAAHIPVVFPLHHRTRASLEKFDIQLPDNVHTIDPLGYIPFLRLVKDAACILTDSGGIQEEATYLQKKCFTLRRNTERPSTIDSGSNTLIDLTDSAQRELVLAFVASPTPPTVLIPPLWDGKAGERILTAVTSS